MPKVAFSRMLATAGWNTTIAREVSAPEIRSMCAEPGGDMALGGAELAGSFLALDLVDEMRLYVHPVLVGRGEGCSAVLGRSAGEREAGEDAGRFVANGARVRLPPRRSGRAPVAQPGAALVARARGLVGRAWPGGC